MMPPQSKRPLVYSCSGCSNVAQLTNTIAVKLDRLGKADMSCIAGVGGGVKGLVKLAKSGRPIIGLDGCPLQCVKHCLAQQGLTADLHIILSEFCLKKKMHQDFDPTEAKTLLPLILEKIKQMENE